MLDWPVCETCRGYQITGTLRLGALSLSSRCRCSDEPHEAAVEAKQRARAAEPLRSGELGLTDVEHLGPGRIAA